jgi:AmmeMemoRadiSam system protein B
MPRKQYAASFYSGASESQIDLFLTGFKPPELASLPLAGLVPHAGWGFSGAVAAKVFQTIKAYRDPKTFVFFGTVHRGIPDNAVYAHGSWMTPFGEVLIDVEFAERILDQTKGFLQRDESAHQYEHSIEVQMPFLKHFFPQAKAVPISVLPDGRAAELGSRMGEIMRGAESDAVLVGTTDLTHYGDNYLFTPRGYGPEGFDWMKRNDGRIIELASKLKAEQIVPEANENQNACGAGAMAATVAAARTLGSANGHVIEYTTSYDIMPERTFRMGVGYVGMIFCAA